MNLADIPDEKIIIVVMFILAITNYFVPGEHPVVNTVINVLAGYMTKAGVDMVKQLALPKPTSSEPETK